MIVKDIIHDITDNYFPPTIIKCNKWRDGTYSFIVGSYYPDDGVYNDSVFGVWTVKYKKLNPYFYCAGQLDIH